MECLPRAETTRPRSSVGGIVANRAPHQRSPAFSAVRQNGVKCQRRVIGHVRTTVGTVCQFLFSVPRTDFSAD